VSICKQSKSVELAAQRVLLDEKDYERWLSGDAGLELLKPVPENALQRWPVSKRVPAPTR
jgi:putative SOS response-associated peptidase YedK